MRTPGVGGNIDPQKWQKVEPKAKRKSQVGDIIKSKIGRLSPALLQKFSKINGLTSDKNLFGTGQVGQEANFKADLVEQGEGLSPETVAKNKGYSSLPDAGKAKKKFESDAKLAGYGGLPKSASPYGDITMETKETGYGGLPKSASPYGDITMETKETGYGILPPVISGYGKLSDFLNPGETQKPTTTGYGGLGVESSYVDVSDFLKPDDMREPTTVGYASLPEQSGNVSGYGDLPPKRADVSSKEKLSNMARSVTNAIGGLLRKIRA